MLNLFLICSLLTASCIGGRQEQWDNLFQNSAQHFNVNNNRVLVEQFRKQVKNEGSPQFLLPLGSVWLNRNGRKEFQPQYS